MTLQKRKSPYSSNIQDSPPLKKPRPEEIGNSDLKEHSQEYPPLPPILPEYENAVFTHTSVAVQSPHSTEMVNYERLEFLGDAQIEHIASLVLWDRFPSANPKRLSSMRESLVRNETLQDFAKMYRFDTRLNMIINRPSPDRPQKDKDRQKIHADVFEAYVAACILSNPDYFQGFTIAKAWLLQLWEPMLDQLAQTTMNPKTVNTRSKEELSKIVLMPGVKLNYVEEKPVVFDRFSGVSTFFIGVYLNGLGYDNQYLGSGSGDNKNAAGQDAARSALENALMNEIKQRKAQLLDQKNSQQNGTVAVKRGANAAEPDSAAHRETKAETTPHG